MPAMYGYFTLPERLYKDDDQVWNELSRVNLPVHAFDYSAGYGACPEVAKIYKTWLDDLARKRTDVGIHPLDFPFVRFCLNHEDGKGRANLFPVEQPETIRQIYTHFGTTIADSFYQEVVAEEGHQFMNRLCSLSAEWECIQFLLQQGDAVEIDQFHSQVNGDKGAPDVAFTLNSQRWYVEAKNLLHEDSNLVFISHVLAGILWLDSEGASLRRWSSISLEGSQIDHEFRKRVIDALRNNIYEIFDDLDGTGLRYVRVVLDGLSLTKYQTSDRKMQVCLKPQRQDARTISAVNFTLRCSEELSRTKTYRIVPQPAYYWPEPLSQALWKKLDGKLAEMAVQINKYNVKPCQCLGFVNLELHEKHFGMNPQKNAEQDWIATIQKLLDKESHPIVLHTRVLHRRDNYKYTTTEVFVLNKSAGEAGFQIPDAGHATYHYFARL